MKERSLKNKKSKSYSPELKVAPVLKVLKEEAIMAQIASEYGAYPSLGSGKITAFLKQEGFKVNRKAIQRHIGNRN